MKKPYVAPVLVRSPRLLGAAAEPVLRPLKATHVGQDDAAEKKAEAEPQDTRLTDNR